jgi:RNA polymerase sigma factor (sigma-70 family)
MNEVVRHLRRAALLQDGAGLTDGVLLESYLRVRDEAAFEALVRRHGPMVWGVCRRVLGHEADAEDAFQATFLVLALKAAAVVPRARVGNWLYGVAHNTARKAKAMNTKRRAKERQAAERTRPGLPEDERQELHDLLDDELSRLPEKYRAPIVLCELEGRTVKEAACQLGWPQGTVAGRLARARVLLAERLTRRGLVLAPGALAAALAPGLASAGMPMAVVAATVKAAGLVAAGPTAAAGQIPAQVAALTERVVKAMLLTKLKTLTLALLAVTLLGGGGVVLTYRALGAAPAPGLAAGPPRAAAPGDEKAKPDKEALQGAWIGVSGERDGNPLPKEAYWKLVLAGDKATLLTGAGNKEREGTFAIDPDKNPKEIALTLGSLVLRGIYELNAKGTTLKILWKENAYPTDFDSKEGILIISEKEKEDAKSDKELLQGTWVGETGERGGQKWPADKLWTLILAADDRVALITEEGGEERKGTYTLEPDKNPKEITLTAGSLVLKGIYELREGTLKSAWKEGATAPTEFDSKEAMLIQFKKK